MEKALIVLIALISFAVFIATLTMPFVILELFRRDKKENKNETLQRLESLEIALKEVINRQARTENVRQSKTPDSRLQTPDSKEEEKDFWDDIEQLQEFIEPEMNTEAFKDLAQTNPLDAQRMAAMRLRELQEQRPRN